MDINTLIDVVAMIDTRIKMYRLADSNDPFYKGAIAGLEGFSEDLQKGIDAVVSAMESNTGE